MTLSTGPNLGLLVNGAAGEGHYDELMRFLRGVDALVMPRVDGYLVNTPPASPADGYTAIIGAAPTGLWAGQGGKVTRWSSVASAYEFYPPRNGWMIQASTARESYRYTSGAWEIYYQEGTWTPYLTGSGGTAGTYTASVAVGTYTKIGQLYSIRMYLILTDKGSWSGTTRIAGLPATASNLSNSYASIAVGLWNKITLSASYTNVSGYVNPGETTMDLAQNGSGQTSSVIDYANVQNASRLMISATYNI